MLDGFYGGMIAVGAVVGLLFLFGFIYNKVESYRGRKESLEFYRERYNEQRDKEYKERQEAWEKEQAEWDRQEKEELTRRAEDAMGTTLPLVKTTPKCSGGCCGGSC